MKVNRILLGMLSNRDIPLPEMGNEPFQPDAVIDDAMKTTSPECLLRTIWKASEEELDIRAVTISTPEGGPKMFYRKDDLETGEIHDVITIVEEASYPLSVAMSLSGRPLDQVVRHDDILGLGLIIQGAKRLAAGGLILTVTHPDGMMATVS